MSYRPEPARLEDARFSPRRARFVELLLAGQHTAVDAYVEAYWNGTYTRNRAYARQHAYKLCRHPSIKKLLTDMRRSRLAAVASATDAVRQIWANAASLDRNELFEIRRIPCRFCYGRDHKFQETINERRAREREQTMLYMATPKVKWREIMPFDDMGGIGYSKRKPPCDDCPECHGLGLTETYMKDTRHMSDAARMLIEGIDIKDGQAVLKLVSRADAEDRLAKSLGMYVSKSVVANVNFDGNALIPDDPQGAADAYKALIGGN